MLVHVFEVKLALNAQFHRCVGLFRDMPTNSIFIRNRFIFERYKAKKVGTICRQGVYRMRQPLQPVINVVTASAQYFVLYLQTSMQTHAPLANCTVNVMMLCSMPYKTIIQYLKWNQYSVDGDTGTHIWRCPGVPILVPNKYLKYHPFVTRICRHQESETCILRVPLKCATVAPLYLGAKRHLIRCRFLDKG